MFSHVKSFFLLICLLSIVSCDNNEELPQDRKIENLAAFAKLYGYVRWFHPSDEAQQIDWNKFAVLGVKKVEKAANTAALKDSLEKLFSPIVQGLQIYNKGDQVELDSMDFIPTNTDSSKLVFWQHRGVGLDSTFIPTFQSRRANLYDGKTESFVEKSISDLSQIKGKLIRVRLSARIISTVDDDEALFYLWSRSTTDTYDTATFDVTANSERIHSNEWRTFELYDSISLSFESGGFGVVTVGQTNFEVKDIDLSVFENRIWRSIKLSKPQFQNNKLIEGANNWYTSGALNCLKHGSNDSTENEIHFHTRLTNRIFERSISKFESIDKSIGRGLSVALPLTLYKEGNQVYSNGNPEEFERLKAEIDQIELDEKFDKHIAIASVIVAWNVFQHFYPYFDNVNVDWNEVLSETICSTYACINSVDFNYVLEKMVAKTRDGHGYVIQDEEQYHLPIKVEEIDTQIVVTGTELDTISDEVYTDFYRMIENRRGNNDSAVKFMTGDIILSVDGVPAMDLLKSTEKVIAGSAHLVRYQALNIFGSSYERKPAKIVVKRNGKILELNCDRNWVSSNLFQSEIWPQYRPQFRIKEVIPHVYYVDLSRIDQNLFESYKDTFANAFCVIYDYRWLGKFSDFIYHIADKPMQTTIGYTPQYIYPDRENMEPDSVSTSSHLEPRQPHFKSESIILTSPSIMSSGETLMGFVDHYNLATTVGSTTGGCNGHINYVDLPCGRTIRWTGVKILKHNGDQLFLKGFEPDYRVHKTIKAIKEGRDEVLERALEIAVSELE